MAHGHRAAAGGDEGRLITYVRNFRSCKTGGLCRQFLGINRRIKLDRLQVRLEDRFASYDIGFVDADLAVKATGTQQCRIQYIGTVGCSEDNNSRVSCKTIHFHQKRV